MKRKVFIVVAVIAVAAGWYLFRPERLFFASTVNESFPAASAHTGANAQPSLVAQGEFHGVAHPAQGKAGVYVLANGKKVLRFSDFETSNGPDVQVYLVAANDATDSDTVKQAGFLSLGPIKGSKGDQNYELPANVDLAKYRSVTVWCKRFGVNFATAPLSKQS